jgi:hypothetical protein
MLAHALGTMGFDPMAERADNGRRRGAARITQFSASEMQTCL